MTILELEIFENITKCTNAGAKKQASCRMIQLQKQPPEVFCKKSRP